MEWVSFIRTFIWQNSGFGDLRHIRTHLEDYEPRYDPNVVPIAESLATVSARSSALSSDSENSILGTINTKAEILLGSRLSCPVPLRLASANDRCKSIASCNPARQLAS